MKVLVEVPGQGFRHPQAVSASGASVVYPTAIRYHLDVGTQGSQPVVQAAAGEPAPVVGPRRAVSHDPPEFEWDEQNEEKLLVRHNVSALEAEQCFANANTRRRQGGALLLMGATDAGRMLFLVYEQKANGVVRVYSAREMTEKERRVYRRNAQ